MCKSIKSSILFQVEDKLFNLYWLFSDFLFWLYFSLNIESLGFDLLMPVLHLTNSIDFLGWLNLISVVSWEKNHAPLSSGSKEADCLNNYHLQLN